MKGKKLYLIIGLAIALVAAAAFVGGRLLNQRTNPLGAMPFSNGDGIMSIAVNVLPAPELPTIVPAVTGLYVERQDNTIIVQSISMDVSGGAGGVVAGSPADASSRPKVEVVVTSDTLIYRDATEMSGPPSNDNATIQQAVEEGSLDDMNAQTMVIVWGRKVGDRIIADVISYSNPIMIKRP